MWNQKKSRNCKGKSSEKKNKNSMTIWVQNNVKFSGSFTSKSFAIHKAIRRLSSFLTSPQPYHPHPLGWQILL